MSPRTGVAQSAPSLAVAAPAVATPIREDGAKLPVTGEIVKVLIHRRDDRGMCLEPFASRCVQQGEVHELVTTDQRETEPGARIDRVGFLGFARIGPAGVLDRGDELWIEERRIGVILGFDGCHLPNHYNILVATETTLTGPDVSLVPGARILFRQVLPDA